MVEYVTRPYSWDHTLFTNIHVWRFSLSQIHRKKLQQQQKCIFVFILNEWNAGQIMKLGFFFVLFGRKKSFLLPVPCLLMLEQIHVCCCSLTTLTNTFNGIYRMKSHSEREEIGKKNKSPVDIRGEKFMVWGEGNGKTVYFAIKSLWYPLNIVCPNRMRRSKCKRKSNWKMYTMHSKRIKTWTQFNNNE